MEVNRDTLAGLIADEQATYARLHPKSKALHDAANHLFGQVPMTWMNMWTGGFPLSMSTARGNRITDVDGLEYVDFALGDTGAMSGHSPDATVAAIQQRVAELGGITTMLPTADAEWVGAELTRRFGMARWSFTLSATDANRWAIRLARLITGRPKILCFSYCYHGSVDETFAVLGPDGSTVARAGNVGPPVGVDQTTRVVGWNDLAGVERALQEGDVAAILTEPALTNIGIVLPEPGFHEGLRRLASEYGALLMIDETHTFSAGAGGATAAWELAPDMFVIGKCIGGGIPSGAYGLTAELAEEVMRLDSTGDADIIDVGGIGGTLAGNALSLAAMRATLSDVLTESAFKGMIELADRYTAGVQSVIDEFDLPWTISQLGARAEYRFCRPEPRDGDASAAAEDPELDSYLHLALCNRGILLTPFHNMALMCPDTTADDVDRHTEVFREVVSRLA